MLKNTFRRGSKTKVRVRAVEDGRARVRPDSLATEEPMEIRLISGGHRQTVAVTMRTPGADFELAAGFLYGEGIVSSAEDIKKISYCVDPDVDAEQQYNIVNVELRGGPGVRPAAAGEALLHLERLRRLRQGEPGAAGAARVPRDPAWATDTGGEDLRPAREAARGARTLRGDRRTARGGPLRRRRASSSRSGRTWGATTRRTSSSGWALLEGRLPLSDHIVMVSGRSSFEILQKSLTAGAPIVCAISAPSSLAVDVARQFGMTLVGFLRGGGSTSTPGKNE